MVATEEATTETVTEVKQSSSNVSQRNKSAYVVEWSEIFVIDRRLGQLGSSVLN